MPEVAEFEPKLALDGGPDGLAIYRELIPQAARRVEVALLLEVESVRLRASPVCAKRLDLTALKSAKIWRELTSGHCQTLNESTKCRLEKSSGLTSSAQIVRCFSSITV